MNLNQYFEYKQRLNLVPPEERSRVTQLLTACYFLMFSKASIEYSGNSLDATSTHHALKELENRLESSLPEVLREQSPAIDKK